MKTIGAFMLAVTLLACSGCAGLTGLITGAFTGAVDLPAETYRHNQQAFERDPILYGLDCLVVAPCGIVGGPVMGLVKGLSLDIEWVCGKVDYGPVWGSYDEPSIWRPWTINWPYARPAMQVAPAATPTPMAK